MRKCLQGELQRELGQPEKEGEEETKHGVIPDQKQPRPDPAGEPWSKSEAWHLFQLRARKLAFTSWSWLRVTGVEDGEGYKLPGVYHTLHVGKVSSAALGKPRRMCRGRCFGSNVNRYTERGPQQ